MNYEKKIMLLLLFTIILFVGYKAIDLRIYKLALNQARLIHKSKAKIKGDNKILKDSYAFKYSDNDSERIILYLENPNAYKGRNILIIDKSSKLIGRPNSNIRDYSKWGNFIFQNDSGERFIPFKNDFKRTYFDPKLALSNGDISFNLPKGEGYKFETLKIIF